MRTLACYEQILKNKKSVLPDFSAGVFQNIFREHPLHLNTEIVGISVSIYVVSNNFTGLGTTNDVTLEGEGIETLGL
jgi:hypothetical protein